MFRFPSYFSDESKLFAKVFALAVAAPVVIGGAKYLDYQNSAPPQNSAPTTTYTAEGPSCKPPLQGQIVLPAGLRFETGSLASRSNFGKRAAPWPFFHALITAQEHPFSKLFAHVVPDEPATPPEPLH
jgi:hypothetical protein